LGVIAHDRENLDGRRARRLLPRLGSIDRRLGVGCLHVTLCLCSPHAGGHHGTAAATPASMIRWPRWAMWRVVCTLVLVAGCWSDDPPTNGLTPDQWAQLRDQFTLGGRGSQPCSDVEANLD